MTRIRFILISVFVSVFLNLSYTQNYHTGGSFGPGFYGPGGLKSSSSDEQKEHKYDNKLSTAKTCYYFKKYKDQMKLVCTERTPRNWRQTFTAFYELNDGRTFMVWSYCYEWVSCEADLRKLIDEGDHVNGEFLYD